MKAKFSLGINMIIEVVKYNDEWPSMFHDEAKHIATVLGGNLLRVFHIGSTSVPGLQAKPVIDIMPVVRDIEKVDSCQSEFKKLGYEYMGEFGMPGRRYMRKGGNQRTHQVHVFQFDNTTDILRHLAFRNYLRCHADVCEAYGNLKAALAARHPTDIEAYCAGKDSFAKQVECDALQWYWEIGDCSSLQQ